jgi:uncharacterized protein
MTETMIRTRSGRYLDLANPDPADILLEDIAVALSRVPRFNGHTTPFYSVAQHSTFTGRMISGKNRLKGYLHDASEAYIADIPTPAKRLMPDYYVVEARLMSAVARAFGLPDGFQHEDVVKEADLTMLFWERDAMIDKDIEWLIEDQHPGGTIQERFPTWRPWNSTEAANNFYAEVVSQL